MLKGCPKCGGDLFLNLLEDSDNLVCLQCGRLVPVKLAKETAESRSS